MMNFKKEKSFVSSLGFRKNKIWIILFSLLAALYILSLFYFSQTSVEGDSKLKQKEKELDEKEIFLLKKEKELEALAKSLNVPIQKKPMSSGAGIDFEKRNAVKEAFLHAWNGYKRVWGNDELLPVDGNPSSNWCACGLTILDSLDTLWIMGLDEEFKNARDWVEKSLHFDIDRSVSLFESTIRILGGLLSAYELSRDKIFLDKAEDLGNRFLPAFESPSGIPYGSVNLKTRRSQNPSWQGGASTLAEVGTLQLEFAYLSKHTGNPIFGEKAVKVFDVLDKAEKRNGLYSVFINPADGRLTRDHVTLGALGDSFYEYLLKYWILTGKQNQKYRNMYDEAMNHVVSKLVRKSSPSQLTYIAEMIGGVENPKMDHLVCFAGGMFALEDRLDLGKEITKTCYEFYRRQPTGISPELVSFQQGQDFIVPSNAKHYLLRPETVESIFVLWRQTHDPIYREMGWKIFQAIEKYCKVKYGYSGIRDVTTIPVVHDNFQQSFFLAETLKYLYLLFSEDELIPLDKYVFNTEAHPLGIFE